MVASGSTPTNPAVRQNPRQVANTIRRTVNYNDTDVTAAPFAGALPAGAQVISQVANVKTAFNAATTNTLVWGTNSTNYNNMCPITAVNLAATGVYEVNSGLGDVGNTSDSVVNAVYSQTGTSATAGQVVITITYEGGWST
jgi:hypothetical protein